MWQGLEILNKSGNLIEDYRRSKPIEFFPASSIEVAKRSWCSSFSNELERTMRLDDRDDFVKLLKAVGSFDDVECKDELVETMRSVMFEFDSANCASAVLTGETDGFCSFSELSDVNWSFLHKAAKLGKPKLTALFLENGFAADDRRCCDELNSKAALPLDLALENIRDNYGLRRWKDNKSAIDLVVLLCQLNFRERLECVRLLVLKTPNADLELWRFLKQGKMVEAGALMMVGCKELLPPALVVHSGHGSLHEEYDSLEMNERDTFSSRPV